MAEEIALFIDFENIRYSLLNTQHREPDPQELINIARRYGTVMVAKAYADWTRQPEMFKGSLTAAMIDRVDCPAKQRDRYRSGAWQPTTATNGWNGATRDADTVAMPILNVGNSGYSGNEDTNDETANRFDALGEPSATSNGSPNATNANGTIQSGSQSTVDLNMLMDIIETVFDRPSISTFVLMTGDRDFTRICARLKLRLNKHVVVAGVPGTVSRDLTAAANQFVLLGHHNSYNSIAAHTPPQLSQPHYGQQQQSGMEATDPQFLQFLDYIDRHWAWRTIIGVSNFIGDPYNHKNRFRGRLTRESARDLLQICIQQGILILQTDNSGNEDLRLNRGNPLVEAALVNAPAQESSRSIVGITTNGHGPYSQMGPWTGSNFTPSASGIFARHATSTIDEDDDEMAMEAGILTPQGELESIE